MKRIFACINAVTHTHPDAGCTLPSLPMGAAMTKTATGVAAGASVSDVYTCSAGYSGTIILMCPTIGVVANVTGSCAQGRLLTFRCDLQLHNLTVGHITDPILCYYAACKVDGTLTPVGVVAKSGSKNVTVPATDSAIAQHFECAPGYEGSVAMATCTMGLISIANHTCKAKGEALVGERVVMMPIV